MTTQMMQFDKARIALEKATRIDEVKQIRDQAAAIERYAKQQKECFQMQQHAAEIKIRAERQAGKLLAEIPREKNQYTRMQVHDVPALDKNTSFTMNEVHDEPRKEEKTYTEILEENQIPRPTAARWQLIAEALDDTEVDTYIEQTKAKQKEITSAELQRLAKHRHTSQHIKQTKQQRQKEGIESEGRKPTIFLQDCRDFLNTLEPQSIDLLLTDPPYSTEIHNLPEFIDGWLPLALSRIKPTGRAFICIGAYPQEIHAYLDFLLRTDWILDAPLIWTYRNTLGQTPKMKYNLNYQLILHLYTQKSPALDTSITKEMFSVQDITAPDGRHNTRFHTWQKPDELGLRLIRHATQPGDLVIDCFACTGTFVLMAEKIGRIGRGCDNNHDNLRIAEDRGAHVVY